MKSIISILILVLSAAIIAETRPRVGLALAGGGAKGFAHIGVLQVLEEEKIPIDYIVGTSMGSIIGAMYAIGYSPDTIAAISRAQDWEFMLSDDIKRKNLSFFDKSEIDRYIVSFPLFEEEKIVALPGGIVEGQNVINLFCRLSAHLHNEDNFDAFPIPFACLACNLETGREYVIRRGYLPQAISASMAIPTVFAPVTIDDSVMVDGGVTNNFPVDVARDMGADILLGVDLDTGLLPHDKLDSITGVLSQLISFMGYDKYTANLDLLDLRIAPDMRGYSTASFSRDAVDTLVARGYKAADSLRAQLAAIREKLNRGDSAKPPVDVPAPDESYFVREIVINGVEPGTSDYILAKLNLKAPGRITLPDIQAGIDRVYGTRNFAQVYFKLEGDAQKTLVLFAETKSISTLNAGFNYNTIDKAAILINTTLSNRQADGARWSLDLKLSANPEAKSSFQFKHNRLPEIGLDLAYKFFKIDVWNRDKKVVTSDVDYLWGDLYLFGVVKNNLMTGFGGRGETFKLAPLFSDPELINSVREKTFFYSLYTFLRFDNLDDLYFPTAGFFADAELNVSYDREKTTSIHDAVYAIFLKAKWARAVTPKLTLLPHIYSRILFNDINPEVKWNWIGGTHHSPYFRETLPFVGLKRVILAQNYLVIGRLDVRWQVFDKHYLTVIGNVALHSPRLDATAKIETIWGGGLLYTYDSLVGPLELYLSVSDFHTKPQGFINLGFWF